MRYRGHTNFNRVAVAGPVALLSIPHTVVCGISFFFTHPVYKTPLNRLLLFFFIFNIEGFQPLEEIVIARKILCTRDSGLVMAFPL